MAAYNSVNGQFATENAHLLVDILQKEWGFRGFTVSDWGATHGAARLPRWPRHRNAIRTAPALPEALGDELTAAVPGGQAAERLDDMVPRVLTAMAAVDLLDGRKVSAQTRHHTGIARSPGRQRQPAPSC